MRPGLGALRPGLLIRPAVEQDCATIAGIYNESVIARGSTFDLEPKTGEHFAALLAGYGPAEALLVLEDAAGIEPRLDCAPPRLAGFGKLVRYSDSTGYRHTGETAVYLWRSLARSGYGAMLKRALLDCARVAGYHHLVAKIVADNTGSIEYNRRFGYELVGTQREVGLIDGAWRDVTIMQLILD